MDDDALNCMVRLRIANLLAWLDELYTPAEAVKWLAAPQKLLNGDVPADLLSEREGFERVRDVVERLKDGVYI